jgi:hypothetical protein
MSQYSTTGIVIAALLFWGVAMSVATWARFKHFGEQLTKPASLLLAGGIWLGIFIIFISSEHYAGNTVSAGMFLVALACYAIMRISNTHPAKATGGKNRAVEQTAPAGFENGMLLSVSLGVFIFASQFSGIESGSNEHWMSLAMSNSEHIDDGTENSLNATDQRKTAHEQPAILVDTAQLPAASASESRAIRLEDGWNISLFHYDQSSATVQIEAVTAQQSDGDTPAYDNTLKPAANKWHQISNVRVVGYPEDSPATWIEVELTEDDINTLRFAAETGAISIYSE